jgi:hypothetical protein
VVWTFADLFKREEKVDEMSKSFILLLHLIRSAPRDMLSEITIEVYGEDSMMAADRKANLETFLKKMTRSWIIPRLTFLTSVRSSRALDARMEYQWNPALR